MTHAICAQVPVIPDSPRVAQSNVFTAQATFHGIDSPISCQLACDTVARSASATSQPPSARGVTMTHSPFASRVPCCGASSAAAAALGCNNTRFLRGHFFEIRYTSRCAGPIAMTTREYWARQTVLVVDNFSPLVLDTWMLTYSHASNVLEAPPGYDPGSRVFLWSTNLLGQFQCQFSVASATGPVCMIQFTPDPDQKIPAQFELHFSLPNSHASAITWRIINTFSHVVTFRIRLSRGCAGQIPMTKREQWLCKPSSS